MTHTDTLNIERLYNEIYFQCEEYLFFEDEKASIQAKRILDVANALYHNALRILRSQSSHILCDNEKISFKQNMALLQKVLNVVCGDKPLDIKDDLIRHLLDSLSFNHAFFNKSAI